MDKVNIAGTFAPFDWLFGGGRVREALRSQGWSNSSHGEPSEWPSSLRSALLSVLATNQPSCLFWGEEQLLFWNEEFRDLVADSAFDGIGLPTPWARTGQWSKLEPLVREVVERGLPLEFRVPSNHAVSHDDRIGGLFMPSRDDGGHVVGVVCLVTHGVASTGRQRALDERLAQLERGVEAAKLGLYEADLEAKNVFWSPQAYANFGVTSDAFTPTLPAVLERIHPDDRERFLSVFPNLELAPQFQVEYRVLHDDGSVRWIRSRGALTGVSAEGRPRTVTGTMVDVTAERAAELLHLRLVERQRDQLDELRLMKLLQRISELTTSSESPEGFLESVVETAISMGRADAGHFQALGPSEDRGTVVAHRGFSHEWIEAWNNTECGFGLGASALAQGEVHFVDDVAHHTALTEEARALKRDAGVRSALAVPLVARSGRLVGALTIHWRQRPDLGPRAVQFLSLLARQAADYVERQANERALRAAEEDARLRLSELETSRQYVAVLQASVARRDEALRVVSHDLRNPLGNIQLQTELLRRRLARDGHPVEKPFDAILRHVTRMREILDEYLNLERLESGSEQLDVTEIGIAALFEEVRAAHELAAAARGLDLLAVVTPPELSVSLDRVRILQVFDNLVSNAMKYTAAGSITLGARSTGHGIEFSVSDTGQGIPSNELERIFDRFWRSPSERGSGAGLGLAIVKWVVEAHGGDVRVDSVLGSGTTFRFSIPLRPRVRDEHRSAPRGRDVILIAEDEPELREALASTLVELGYEVVATANGREALDALATEALPAAAIIDLGMPLVDGWGVLAARNGDPMWRDVPFVVLSGMTDVGDRVAKAGATFLPKPVSIEQLSSLLRGLAHERRSSDVAEGRLSN